MQPLLINHVGVSCRLFGGLIADIKRKAPWYLSDYTDALHPQCIASLFFMYFACLAPIVTFGGLLGDATDNNIVSAHNILFFSADVLNKQTLLP